MEGGPPEPEGCTPPTGQQGETATHVPDPWHLRRYNPLEPQNHCAE